MHLASLISDLAVILLIAGLMSLLFQRIKQPVVLGYLIAGMVVGPHTPPFQLVADIEGIQTWAELGVIFLMFSLGLEFSFRKLASVGGSAAITAGTEVLFFLPVGYLTGRALGWPSMDSIFLGAMLSVSSTTIIIKALDELKLKTHRFAELIFGALVVEDLIAILLLVALSTIAASSSISAWALLMAALKLVLVVSSWFIVGYFAVPRFMRYVGKFGNDEMLTLLSLGLCLGLVIFAARFHYSSALGAFIMGSILAESPVLHRIEERMTPLRDLFGAVFFVSIGMLIDPKLLWEYKSTVALICGVTIIGKIVSTSLGALVSGQTFKNSLQVGFGLAQIGEFSFIIAGVGLSLKATSDFLYPVAVAVSLITTFTTPYLIRYSGPIAEAVERRLPDSARRALNEYALWNEKRRTQAAGRKSVLTLVLRWLINGLIVSVVFTLAREFLLPFLGKLGFDAPVFAWAGAILFAAPFIWGMLLVSARDVWPLSLFLYRALTLVWICVLSMEFFPGRYILMSVAAAGVLLLGFFYPRLGRYYHWYEKRFLATFEAKKEGEKVAPASEFGHLAPWDAHLVRLKVHSNAALVLKRLLDAELRTRFGVNVVAIKRGYETVVAPKPSELILPGDELIVLGSDRQVEAVKQQIEVPSSMSADADAEKDYGLRSLVLGPKSELVGKSIRESGIRERFHCMVVGLERDGDRKMSPDSDLAIQSGDLLWLVGEANDLQKLAASQEASIS